MMNATSFQTAARRQESILTPLEKRVLAWFVRHLPGWVNSDHLTSLGFAAMFLAGTSYVLARWNPVMLFAASGFLALNWFGDSLDGSLARHRQRLRPRYGFYVDHIVDAFGTLFLIGGLGLSGYMTPAVAMAVLIAFFLLMIEIYLTTHVMGVFRLSFGAWGPTELRILVGVGNCILYLKPHVGIAGRSWLLCDASAVVAIGLMLGIVVQSAIKTTVLLYNEERIR